MWREIKKEKEGKGKLNCNRSRLLFPRRHQDVIDTTFQSKPWVADLSMRWSKTSDMPASLTSVGGVKRLAVIEDEKRRVSERVAGVLGH